MRLRSIVDEASRDVRSGAGATAAAAAVFVLLVGGLLVAAAGQRAADVRQAERFVAAGAATSIERSDGRIDGRSCSRLVELPNVVAAGAVRRTEAELVPAVTPRSPVPLFEVSPGFERVLGVAPGRSGSPGVLLPRGLAGALGVGAGEDLATADAPVPVAAVYDHPEDGRVSPLSWAAVGVAPLDGRPFDECWATIWPEDEASVAALSATLLPKVGDGEPPTLRQLNGTFGGTFSATRRADGVVPSSVGSFAAAVAAVLGCTIVLRRRLALASDRHVGVTRSAQLATQLAQGVTWILPGAVVIVLATLLVTGPLSAGDRWPIIAEVVVRTAAAAAAALGGITVGVSCVRERSLLRYFKERR